MPPADTIIWFPDVPRNLSPLALHLIVTCCKCSERLLDVSLVVP